MALKGFRKTTRCFIATAIGSIAVAASLALAGQPGGVWLRAGGPGEQPAANRDFARNAQSLRYLQIGAKDGLTPISAEVRGVPRAEQSAPLRGAGSIRADITRYNEERNVPRPPGRSSDEARVQSNPNYRN